MNRKKQTIIMMFIIGILMSSFLLVQIYQYIRLKTAKIEVMLVDDLSVEVYDNKKISDFIHSINGTLLDDKKIDTTKLGKKNITFHYKNEENIKIPYSFQIEVVDTTEPMIWLGSSYSIKKGEDVALSKKILCGDNYDNTPKCQVVGNYDVKKEGSYPLVFKAEDQSGNKVEHPFTLHVYEPKNNGESKQVPTINYVQFSDVVKKYKTDHTKIGIDVSSWQGDIDFEKIKKAGVEFIIIRVGSYTGDEEKYFVDKKFVQNIKGANEHDIDVGIYFYSYSSSIKEAKEDARWVLEQIKDYEVTLPIAYDWEDWAYFNDYKLSFFGLTSMAEAFLEEVEKNGYEGMLYSSKTYLENIWFPTNYDIWLAHYVDQTSYTGDYKFWQLTDKGKVDGINGTVDINIMYQ